MAEMTDKEIELLIRASFHNDKEARKQYYELNGLDPKEIELEDERDRKWAKEMAEKYLK